MKLTAIFLAGLAASPLPGALAHPGMGDTLKEVENIARGYPSYSSNMLLGDLRYLKSRKLSASGKAIKDLLQGGGNPESGEQYQNVPRLNSGNCRRDTCCVWKYISDDMEKMFRGRSGRCTKWARYAIRAGFHDAGGWSLATEQQGGGADGSLVLANEVAREENTGLKDIARKYTELYNKYHNELGFREVGMADLIQMGSNVAAVVCPLGPRTRSWVGRKDSHTPNPRLLPSPFASADELIQLFKDKTISPHGLVALLGAHTTSQQNHVNGTRAGDPQDSTPGVWDTLYYQQTLGVANTPDRVFMFPSDVNLAKHPTTKPDYEQFAGRGGQSRWNQDYAREYIRLSLLGVNNINDLTECTKVLPMPTSGYRQKDQSKMDKWLASPETSRKSKDISAEVENGDEISTPYDNIPVWKKKSGAYKGYW